MVFPTNAAHPAVPDADTQLVQFLGHPGPAVATWAGPMLVPDMRQQHHVTSLSVRYRAMFPCPQATIRNPHHTAGTRLRKDAAIIIKERKLHGVGQSLGPMAFLPSMGREELSGLF